MTTASNLVCHSHLYTVVTESARMCDAASDTYLVISMEVLEEALLFGCRNLDHVRGHKYWQDEHY